MLIFNNVSIRNAILLVLFCSFLLSSFIFLKTHKNTNGVGVYVLHQRLLNNQLYTIVDLVNDAHFLVVNIFFLFFSNPQLLLMYAVFFVLTYAWLMYSVFLIVVLIFLRIITDRGRINYSVFFFFHKEVKDDLFFHSKHPYIYFTFFFQQQYANRLVDNFKKLLIKKKTKHDFLLYTNRYFIVVISGFSIKTFEIFPVVAEMLEKIV